MTTQSQPPKFPAAAAVAVLAASALLFTMPPAPPDYLFDLVATCVPNDWPAATGIIWSAGNQSGQYPIQYLTPPTNTFTFSNLDSRLPWFVTAQTYQTNEFYDEQCLTNDDGSESCVTNFSNIGPMAPEQITIGKDAMPTMRVIQGVPVLMLYGVTNRTYWVASGQELNSLTNTNGPIQGTNGLQMLAHFGPEPSWYFQTLVQ